MSQKLLKSIAISVSLLYCIYYGIQLYVLYFHCLLLQVGVAYALYIGPSIIDHSCQPTASVSFDLVKEG